MTKRPELERILDPHLRTLLSRPKAVLTDLRGAREAMASENPVVSTGLESKSLSAATAQMEAGRLGEIDLVVPSLSGGIPIRLYMPTEPSDSAPVVLLLHGGAFVGGDAGSERDRCIRFAEDAGVIVVAPEYRLAPEHPYPAALDDCSTVLSWICERTDGSSSHADQLIVAGVSAGGALAAGLVLRHGAEISFAGLMLLCPVLDDRNHYASRTRFETTPVWDSPSNRLMWQLYLGAEQPDELSSPARASDLSIFPSTYVQVAELDTLRDEALQFAARLLAAKVSVDLRVWARTCHVFDQAVPLAPISVRSVDDQIAFLTSLLSADDTHAAHFR